MSTRMAGRLWSEPNLGGFFVANGMSISRRFATCREAILRSWHRQGRDEQDGRAMPG